MDRRNNRSENKRDSDGADNVRNSHGLSESDVEEHEECEDDDDRDWQEKFLQLRKI